MNLMKRFQQYAAAFEETYVDDDWSRLEPYFAPDASYDVQGMPLFPIQARGRDEVFDALREAIDAFDRRFDSRQLAPTGPPEISDHVLTIPWAGTYTLEGAPDLAVEGVEEAHYGENGEILRLIDVYSPQVAEKVAQWMDAHGSRLPSKN